MSPRYPVTETGREPFKFMVLDTETDKAAAFCMKQETADGSAQQLNTKGFIEI